MLVDKNQVLGLVATRVAALEARLKELSAGVAVSSISKWHIEGGIHELEELVLLVNVLPVVSESSVV